VSQVSRINERKGNKLRKIPQENIVLIYTDRFHYHLRIRSAPLHDENQYLTIKWRNWFENTILRLNATRRTLNTTDPSSNDIYGSLRCCYRRTLRKLDSNIYGKPRLTPLNELFRVFQEEVQLEANNARKQRMSEKAIESLQERFASMKMLARLWNIRTGSKLHQ